MVAVGARADLGQPGRKALRANRGQVEFYAELVRRFYRFGRWLDDRRQHRADLRHGLRRRYAALRDRRHRCQQLVERDAGTGRQGRDLANRLRQFADRGLSGTHRDEQRVADRCRFAGRQAVGVEDRCQAIGGRGDISDATDGQPVGRGQQFGCLGGIGRAGRDDVVQRAGVGDDVAAVFPRQPLDRLAQAVDLADVVEQCRDLGQRSAEFRRLARGLGNAGKPDRDATERQQAG